jgi:hypothetical protein
MIKLPEWLLLLLHIFLHLVSYDESPWINPFSDVTANNWFYDAVKFANQNNLFSGTSVGRLSQYQYDSRYAGNSAIPAGRQTSSKW